MAVGLWAQNAVADIQFIPLNGCSGGTSYNNYGPCTATTTCPAGYVIIGLINNGRGQTIAARSGGGNRVVDINDNTVFNGNAGFSCTYEGGSYGIGAPITITSNSISGTATSNRDWDYAGCRGVGSLICAKVCN